MDGIGDLDAIAPPDDPDIDGDLGRERNDLDTARAPNGVGVALDERLVSRRRGAKGTAEIPPPRA